MYTSPNTATAKFGDGVFDRYHIYPMTTMRLLIDPCPPTPSRKNTLIVPPCVYALGGELVANYDHETWNCDCWRRSYDRGPLLKTMVLPPVCARRDPLRPGGVFRCGGDPRGLGPFPNARYTIMLQQRSQHVAKRLISANVDESKKELP